MSKCERFNEAFSYLKKNKVIKTQKEVADVMQSTQGNVSLALSGAQLTDKFIRRFCEAFPQVSEAYILTGLGALSTSSAPPHEEIVERHAEVSIVELAASLIKENEALRRDLVATINEVHRLRDEMSHDRDAISSIRSSLSAILYNHQTSRPIPMAAENEK